MTSVPACSAPTTAGLRSRRAARLALLLLTTSAMVLPGMAMAAGGQGGGGGLDYADAAPGGTGYDGEPGAKADDPDWVHAGGGGGAAGGGLGGLGGPGSGSTPDGMGGSGGAGGLNNQNGGIDGDGDDGQNGDGTQMGGEPGGSGGGGGMGGAGFYYGSSIEDLAAELSGITYVLGGKGGNGGLGFAKGGAGGFGGDGGAGIVTRNGMIFVNVNVDTVTGGAGGNGGAGALIGPPGVAGGAGDGGAGILVGTGGMIGITGTAITGGKGGNGGAGRVARTEAIGGDGGNGGAGIDASQAGIIYLTEGGSITGGDGGDGGASVGSQAGKGGDGGAGVYLSGEAYAEVETGTSVTGGKGGKGGSTSTAGADGAGGVGIMANGGAIVVVGGGVSGGLDGSGQNRADALLFNGGDNTLALIDGYGFTGKVESTGDGSDTLALAGGDNSTFDLGTLETQFVGFSALEKSDSSTWTLTGSSSFAGTTTIRKGILLFDDASLASSNLTIKGSGTLMGTGTVNDVQVLAGGIIAPGDGIGTFTVGGDLTFSANSIYAADVAPDLTGDLLDVTGTATLAGMVIVTSSAGANLFPDDPSTYTILQANSISGTFDALDTSALAFFDGELDYDSPGIVQLTLTRNDLALSDVARNDNQKNTAGAVESLGNSNDLYAGILDLSEEEAQSAYQQLSGESLGAGDAGQKQTADLVTQAMTNRVNELLGALDGAEASGYAPVTGSGPADPNHSIWISGYGARASIDAGSENAASLTDTAGLTFGLDGEIGEWTFGVMGGYGQSESNVDELGTSIGSSDYSAGVYAGGKWVSVRAVLGAVYTGSSFDSTRTITLPSAETLTADYGGSTGTIFGEVSNEFDFGAVSLTPFAGAQYLRATSDAYTETGGSAALAVDARSSDVAYTTVGLRSSADFVVDGGMLLSLGAGAGWRHAFADDAMVTHSFVAGGDSFAVSSAQVPADRLAVEASAGLDVSANLALDLSYTGEFTADSQTSQLQAGVKGSF